MDRIYPHLDPDVERRLEAILHLADKDIGYFSDPRCPYPWLRPFMQRRVAEKADGGGVPRVGMFGAEGEDEDVVLREVEATIEEMKAIAEELGTAEPADRTAFYKTYTGLLEKWTGLKERLINIKHIRDFQRVIVAFMEEVLDKDQQQEFKNRLKNVMV